MTSSPGPTPESMAAISSAAVHEWVSRALAAPVRSRSHAEHCRVKLPSPAEVDASYRELSGRGVPFQAPPADYEWNAYCCYFTGPDDEVWELYAWRQGGAPGKLET